MRRQRLRRGRSPSGRWGGTCVGACGFGHLGDFRRIEVWHVSASVVGVGGGCGGGLKLRRVRLDPALDLVAGSRRLCVNFILVLRVRHRLHHRFVCFVRHGLRLGLRCAAAPSSLGARRVLPRVRAPAPGRARAETSALDAALPPRASLALPRQLAPAGAPRAFAALPALRADALRAGAQQRVHRRRARARACAAAAARARLTRPLALSASAAPPRHALTGRLAGVPPGARCGAVPRLGLPRASPRPPRQPQQPRPPPKGPMHTQMCTRRDPREIPSIQCARMHALSRARSPPLLSNLNMTRKTRARHHT